jgi:hypothetical protein
VSKAVLWIVIGVASFVVVLLALLTPTVIERDNDNQVRSVRVMPAAPVPAPEPRPAPFPFGRDLLPPDLRACLQSYGFGDPGRDTLPDSDKLRGALKDCAGQLFDGRLPFDA